MFINISININQILQIFFNNPFGNPSIYSTAHIYGTKFYNKEDKVKADIIINCTSTKINRVKNIFLYDLQKVLLSTSVNSRVTEKEIRYSMKIIRIDDILKLMVDRVSLTEKSMYLEMKDSKIWWKPVKKKMKAKLEIIENQPLSLSSPENSGCCQTFV